MHSNQKEFDVIIIGGGITGLAVAYGLSKTDPKLSIALIDSPTAVNKASRTNVGLLWCQSKFKHEPDYARLGFLSYRLFPQLVRELEEISNIEIPVNFTGGLIPVLSEEEYNQKDKYIAGLKEVLGDYPGNMINRSELEKKLPKINFGHEVLGASWCEEDGVIEPLLLLRAYRKSLEAQGVCVFEDTMVYDVVPKSKTEYQIESSKGTFSCERVVLAAGLANKRLAEFALNVDGKKSSDAEKAGLPIFADKGQVLLTERLPFVMPIPILSCTQTFGGTVIIGFRHETRGHDATVIPQSVSQEGAWAIRVWPELATKRIIRSWPGLRIMPNDKKAIYSRLPGHPNATVLNTHSAVTLAAAHSAFLPDFIMGREHNKILAGMTLKRFGFDC